VAPIRWTRTALAARVESIEQKSSGRDFVAAVVAFADTLEPEDRRLLQDVLLARADADRVFIEYGRSGQHRRRSSRGRDRDEGSPPTR
jgi:hypothetical protein